MTEYDAASESDRRIADRRRMADDPRERARQVTAWLSPVNQYKLACEILAQVAQTWSYTRPRDAKELEHLLEAIRGLGNGLM